MPYSIEDLMANAIGQRPMDFEQSFNAIMMDKAAQAVETHKAEIAKSMFNGDPRPEVETEEEDPSTEE